MMATSKQEDIKLRLSAPKLSSSQVEDAASSVSVVKHWSWREPPDQSLSDWTIIVDTNSTRVTYHVHKSALVYGGSGYFERLFASEMNVQEMQTLTSTFDNFEELAGQVFPVMLDYLYHVAKEHTHKFEIEGQSSVGLRFLAAYFDIDGLQDLVIDCLGDYLDKNNCISVLTQSHYFHDELLSEVAADECAEHLNSINQTELLSLSPPLFEMVMKSNKKVVDNTSQHSTLCYEYVRKSNIHPSSEDFRAITTCEHFSEMTLEAALGFFNFLGNNNLSSICNDDEISSSNIQSTTTSSSYSKTLCSSCGSKQCLWDRCSKTLADNVLNCSRTYDINKYLDTLDQDQLQKVLQTVLLGFDESYEKLQQLFVQHRRKHDQLSLDYASQKQKYDELQSALTSQKKRYMQLNSEKLKQKKKFDELQADLVREKKKQEEMLSEVATYLRIKRVVAYDDKINNNNNNSTTKEEIIHVSGAGLSFINGVYFKVGKSEGQDFYEKGAIVEGEPVILKIIFKTNSNSSSIAGNKNNTIKKWVICDGREHPDGGGYIYYYTKFEEGSHPADCRWMVAKDGSITTPTLTRNTFLLSSKIR